MLMIVLVAVMVTGATRAVIEAGFVPPAATETLIENSRVIETMPTAEPETKTTLEEEKLSTERVYEAVTANTSPGYPYLLPGWRGKLRRALDKRIDVNFDKTHFDDALSFVAERIGVRIIVDKGLDTRSFHVTLKLCQIRALNVLHLVLAVDENLGFKLAPGAISVCKCGNDYNYMWGWQDETEKVLADIELARLAIASGKEYDRLYLAFMYSRTREFDWKGMTIGEAVKEIGGAYDLNVVVDPRLDDELVLQKAPQVHFKGNAQYALENLTDKLGLVYYFKIDGVLITEKDFFPDCSDLAEKWREAFEQFVDRPFIWDTRNILLNELLEKIELETGVSIIPDRATWEAQIKVSIVAKKPIIGHLLNYLLNVHGVEHWFDVDSDTGRETLYLLKSP